MRSLAKRLGCGAMSLYNHVSDKDDLIQAMADAVAADIELPVDRPAHTCREDLRACAISAYRVMLDHPWLARVWGRCNGPNKHRYHEALLRTMRQAGYDEPLACQGFHGITMHVVGFALQVSDMPQAVQEDLRGVAQKTLEELDAQTFPFMREHIQFHLNGGDQRSDFKFMLDLILDGLARDHHGDQNQPV